MCTGSWIPVQGEKLKAIIELNNIENKFAVAIIKNDCLVGHLPKEKTGLFFVFYKPLIVTFVCWKSLTKLSVKEMGKE